MEDKPSKKLYRVTLVPYPEAPPYVMFVAKGERLDEPPVPRLSHCVNLGWFRDGDARRQWDFERDRVQEDTVLCVRWRTTVTYLTEPDRPFAIAPGVVGERAQQLDAPLAPSSAAGHIQQLAESPMPGSAAGHVQQLAASLVPSVGSERAWQLAAPNASGSHVGSYSFAGWHYDRACTDPWDFHRDRIYPDTRLYAKWVTSE